MLRLVCKLMCTVGLLLTAAGADAQQYPTRPIRFVQGFAPGGNADVITRVLGAEMSKGLGQPVISEARIGAGGNIAAELVANATPDGYTYLVSGATMAVNMSLYKNLRYDFLRDFAHVSQTFSSANVLVVVPNLPVANLAEFIAYVKSGQHTVNYGSGGHGTSQHLAAALFNHMVAGNMVHVATRVAPRRLWRYSPAKFTSYLRR